MDFPHDFGPYTLIKQIAVGGMAEIVLAKTKGFSGFEKYLALKMIHPRLAEDQHFINMLIEEAKICVELSHANICQVFDLGRISETHFLSMEYVEGVDVFRVMRRATEIGYEVPIENCVFVGNEICAGLDYAHNKRDSEGRPFGIIHRDISPQNILVSYAGEVKIIDFGIAKAGLRAKQTEVGVIKGKYYYMSPEQAWADPVDQRTDLFSAGIIIYEMLTGQMLYLEENIERLLDRVRKAEIEPPSTLRPEIPPELDDIVMKALAKYPDDRYQNAQEMGQALGNYLYLNGANYTSSRLASMMGWLFDQEIHETNLDLERSEPEAIEPESMLLTRQDIVIEDIKSAGSLLFNLADLQSLDGGTTGDLERAMGDLGPTAEVDVPPDETHRTVRIDRTGELDETSQVSLPYDLMKLFPTPSGTDSDWHNTDDETTLDTPILDATTSGRPTSRAKIGRRPDEETHVISSIPRIDALSASSSPSYQPPPPPELVQGGLSRPSSSYSPPAPGSLGGPTARPRDALTPDLSSPSRLDDGGSHDTTRAPASSLMSKDSTPPSQPRRPSVHLPTPRREASKHAPRPRSESDSIANMPSPFLPSLDVGPKNPVGPPSPRLASPTTKPLPSIDSLGEDIYDQTSPHNLLPGMSRRPSGRVGPPPPRALDTSENTARSLRLPAEVQDQTDLSAYAPPDLQRSGAGETDTNPATLIPQHDEVPLHSSVSGLLHLGLRPVESSHSTAVIPGRMNTPVEASSADLHMPPHGPAPEGRHMRQSPAAPQRPAPPHPQGRSQPQGQPPPTPQRSSRMPQAGLQQLLPSGAMGSSQLPPWMISSGPFVGRNPPSAPQRHEEEEEEEEVWDDDEEYDDPDMLDGDLLEEPPDPELDFEPSIKRFNLRPMILVAAPLLGIAALITAIYMVWPHSQPPARLDIRSHPAGAQVIFDGHPLPGRTPTAVEELEFGSLHQVELRLDGFIPWTQPVEIRSTEVRQIAILRPIQGTLHVNSLPAGASVSLDGVYQGLTPLTIAELDINREPRLQVRYGGQAQTRTHIWAGETEVTLEFQFEEERRRR